MTRNAGNTDAADLEQRLAFMKLGEAEQQALRSIGSVITGEVQNALETFYAQLRKTPEVRRFFPTEEHINHAKAAQGRHWQTISSASYDAGYMRQVQTIGSVHARIGLEPRWYIGGYALILDHLIGAVIREQVGKGGLLRSRSRDAERLGRLLGALVKATMLDVDLAISVYMDKAEEALRDAEETAIAQERAAVCAVFGKAMAAMADRDLTYRIRDELPEAYAGLRDDFNRALEAQEAGLQTIAVSSREIAAGSENLLAQANDLSQRTEEQAASLEESAAALEEIATNVRNASRRADEATQLVSAAHKGAERSGAVVDQAVKAMEAISASSQAISNIIGVIDEIAFQTNLLALNAGIEAARAGDSGKGFAVVAQEVRELAQRSASAAQEIKVLIGSSGQQVEAGVSLVGETGAALATIMQAVKEISEHILHIAASSREQAGAITEISSAVNSMDQATQLNAAMVQQSTAASHALFEEVGRIAKLVGAYRLGEEGAPAFRQSA